MIFNKSLNDCKNIDEIKILGIEFVRKNKNKANLIINNKKIKLKEYIHFNINYIKDDKINIGTIFKEKYVDGSCMFKNCSTLSQFSNCDILENLNDNDFQEFDDNKNSFIDIYNENSENIISDVSIFNNLKQNKDDTLLNFSEITMKEANEKHDYSIVYNYIYNYSKLIGIFPNCEPLIFIAYKPIYHNIFTNMKEMFYNCISLSSLPDISKWNTSLVNNMSGLFSGCSSLLYLPDISEWNTSNVTNISEMFCNCNILYLPNISKWDTKNIKSMNRLFYCCYSLLSLPDISKWNMSNAFDISEMFYFCRSLTTLPYISKWDTSNLINMSYSFSNCTGLMSFPNISRWNISKVYDMSWMFTNCRSLISLPDISKWNTSILKYFVINLN